MYALSVSGQMPDPREFQGMGGVRAARRSGGGGGGGGRRDPYAGLRTMFDDDVDDYDDGDGFVVGDDVED